MIFTRVKAWPGRRRQGRPRGVLLWVLLALGTPALKAEPALAPALERFVEATAQRAALMGPVAEAKAVLGLAIQDPAQEARVLARAEREAHTKGLAVAPYRRFVDAQMALARGLQSRWRSVAPPGMDSGEARAALGAVRRAIAATTAAQLDALVQTLPLLPRQQDAFLGALNAALAAQGASSEERAALGAAALALRFAPASQDELAALGGTLRVGTTGDYAPFSYRASDGALQGVDIDLAEAFAEALGLRLAWVETSWPTLTQDLQAGAFDLALSGISRTLARARRSGSRFSLPYHVGGKTPIIRCADQARFPSWAAIDQPGVRAVVNPGGTNEAFARARYTQAGLRVHPDNRTIFQEIAEGRADVMVTDLIEVKLWAGRDPRLCPALGDTRLTYAEKGAWIATPAGDALAEVFDLWLTQQLGSGFVAERFAAHGVGP
jgi:cyclohexadienyl dehydratase